MLQEWITALRATAVELHLSRRGAGAIVLRWIGIAFAFGETGAPISAHLSATATLNFGAPAGVPGSVSLTISVPGAAFGDTVTVGAPIAVGANYLLTAFVSAADTVTVRWTQISGSAADPDGAGGVYRVDVWKH